MSDDKDADPNVAPGAKPAPKPAAKARPAERVAGLPVVAARGRRADGDKFIELCHATLASIGASQAAVASELTAMALELDEIARSNLTAAGDSVTALFGARNMVDAVEIQLGFARRSLGTIAAGSGRLSELGLRVYSGAAKPFLRLHPTT